MTRTRLLVTSWIAALLATSIVAAPAAAQGVNLFWSDCSVFGTTNRTFACNTNDGPPFTLVVSFYPPAAMPRFAGLDFALRYVSSSFTLPSWWQLGDGECRAGAAVAAFDDASLPTLQCESAWGGLTPAAAFAIQTDAAHARWRLDASATLAGPVPITEAQVGTELVAAVVRISRVKTTGADACPGCLTGGCFVLDRVVAREAGNAGEFVLVNPGVNNITFWNGGGPFPSCAVPSLERSWGQIKGLYR